MKLGFLRPGPKSMGLEQAGLGRAGGDSEGASRVGERCGSGDESPGCNMNPSQDKRSWEWAQRRGDRRMNGRSHKAPSLLLVSGVTSQWDQCHLPASGGDSVHS